LRSYQGFAQNEFLLEYLDAAKCCLLQFCNIYTNKRAVILLERNLIPSAEDVTKNTYICASIYSSMTIDTIFRIVICK